MHYFNLIWLVTVLNILQLFSVSLPRVSRLTGEQTLYPVHESKTSTLNMTLVVHVEKSKLWLPCAFEANSATKMIIGYQYLMIHLHRKLAGKTCKDQKYRRLLVLALTEKCIHRLPLRQVRQGCPWNKDFLQKNRRQNEITSSWALKHRTHRRHWRPKQTSLAARSVQPHGAWVHLETKGRDQKHEEPGKLTPTKRSTCPKASIMFEPTWVTSFEEVIIKFMMISHILDVIIPGTEKKCHHESDSI